MPPTPPLPQAGIDGDCRKTTRAGLSRAQAASDDDDDDNHVIIRQRRAGRKKKDSDILYLSE